MYENVGHRESVLVVKLVVLSCADLLADVVRTSSGVHVSTQRRRRRNTSTGPVHNVNSDIIPVLIAAIYACISLQF